MKKHAIAAIAAAMLASAVSYAYGETGTASPQRSQKAVQFADQFEHLQGIASNSSAFMQPTTGHGHASAMKSNAAARHQTTMQAPVAR
jgi:hypothetical protein